jgi:hypothetical protein
VNGDLAVRHESSSHGQPTVLIDTKREVLRQRLPKLLWLGKSPSNSVRNYGTDIAERFVELLSPIGVQPWDRIVKAVDLADELVEVSEGAQRIIVFRVIEHGFCLSIDSIVLPVNAGSPWLRSGDRGATRYRRLRSR